MLSLSVSPLLCFLKYTHYTYVCWEGCSIDFYCFDTEQMILAIPIGVCDIDKNGYFDISAGILLIRRYFGECFCAGTIVDLGCCGLLTLKLFIFLIFCAVVSLQQ